MKHIETLIQDIYQLVSTSDADDSVDVDAEIVTKDNVETYVKNHCNALEYEWEDYMLGSEEHPNLRINEEEIWIEGENQ